MRKLPILFLLTLSACAGIIGNIEIVNAQTFPQTVHAEVDVPTDVTITSFIITWDNAAPVTYPNVTTAVCANGLACVKSPTIQINDSNAHTFSIVSHNSWGNSTSLAGTFQVKIPNKPTSTGNTVQPGT